MVARYKTADITTDPRACGPSNDNKICLSSLSIDGQSQHLISAEHLGGAGGRIYRWPLGPLSAALPQPANAVAGYTTPVFKVQGIASDGTNLYMSGDCPETWSAGYSCIHVAQPGQAPHVLTQAPSLTQGLSWAPQAGRLWGLNEALATSGVGRRVVFSIDPDAGKEVGGWGWMSNFTEPGFVCATPQGEGTANGTIVTVWNCTGAESQRWAFQNGRLVHKVSGKCLTPQGDASSTDGALLTLWTCNSAAESQKFFPYNGTISNSHGKAVTPKGGSLGKGVYLTLWQFIGPTASDVLKWSVKGF
ncbi:RICIN domain-containing protein [Streptomyces sp. NPDC056948]|uniref:RICIN domain-containing protein n=1 Tax=Streptomyces sp. NPDC056948 TaxID=3345975 RepID=UPI00362CA5DB